MRVLLLALLVLPLTAADPAGSMVFVGRGSGVLLPGGRILTNHHVAEDIASPWAPACTVRLPDGRECPARLRGTDPVGDLALLVLDPPVDGLPGVELADADALLPGRAVVAVGNPFGLGDYDDRPTITHGILSTGLVARGTYPLAVLTDAPVNPGNSGGALLLADTGRLAGINGAIRTRTGFAANSGIAIAIAAPQIQRILPLLDAGQVVARARLAESITDGPDGPVDADGHRIRTVAGQPVVSASGAKAAIAAHPWSPDLTLSIDGRPARLERHPLPGTPWMGWRLEDRGGRLVLADCDDPGPAFAAGLRLGAHLLTLDGQPVRRPLDALRLLAPRGAGETISVGFRLGTETQTVQVVIGWR